MSKGRLMVEEQPYLQLPIPSYLPRDPPKDPSSEEEEDEEKCRVIIIEI